MSESTMMRVFVMEHRIDPIDVSTWPTSNDDGHAFVAGICRVGGCIVGGDHHGEWVDRRYPYAKVNDLPALGLVVEWPIVATKHSYTEFNVEPA